MWKVYVWATTIFSAALLLAACDTNNEQQESKEKVAQIEARRDAEDAAERDLFSDPHIAEAEIERRLARFISVREGMFIVTERRASDPEKIRALHALPLSTTWHARCSGGRLEFTFGPQDGEGDVIPPPKLIKARLPEDQCEWIVLAIGRAILRKSRQ